MRDWENAELIDDPNVLKVWADDVGSMEIMGPRTRLVYIEYRKMNGIWVKAPVVEMIRPTETVGIGRLRRLCRNLTPEQRQDLAFGALH